MKTKTIVSLLGILTLFGLLLGSSPDLAMAQDPDQHRIYLPLVLKGSGSTATPPDDGIWRDVDEASIVGDGERLIIPKAYRTLAADLPKLDAFLAGVPLENTPAAQERRAVIKLPLPDGTFGRFLIQESPILEPGLAAKFPDIKTYQGQGLDDPTATVRLDRTPLGFHAMILSGTGSVYIDPYRRGDVEHYISYYKKDFEKEIVGPLEPDYAQENPEPTSPLAGLDLSVRDASGDTLRTYRIAVAATGEYTAFHGGTVALALAEITTAMNRVNGIYEREVAVRMNLIADNDDLIYTDGTTDPYTNNDGSTMLGENQSNVDSVIGSANYDIGHVVSTGGGGIATLGVTCQNGIKARGVTGLGNPIGDPFYVDFVAHEIGHQFNANHTFNGTTGNCGGGNRNGSTAYEPGSGSTIMAYAGTCGAENLQPNSDDYFHTISFDEIVAYTTSGAGSTCGTTAATGNSAPSVNAGPSYVIPIQTPFEMRGSATDPEGDALTYAWEQFDLGAAAPPNTDDGGRPIFRSFDPVTVPSRTFPRLSDILNNTTTFGESLPTTSRTLTFRLTARDNRAGGGGVDYDTTSLSVTNTAGPFRVTSPNTAVTWSVADSETVTWDVANTDVAPVSCANVNILLSTDGGLTFPITLAANTANDGAQPITVPDTATTVARVKVACAGNIFFDISDANFTIERRADLAISKTDSVDPVVAGTSLTYELTIVNNGPSDASGVTVVDSLPAGVSLVSDIPSQGSCGGTSTVTCNLGNLADGGLASVTIVVDVSSSAADGASLVNSADVAGNEFDPTPGNNQTSEETAVIRVADLALVKTDDPDPVYAGEELTYSLALTNNGPSDASDVTLTDTLPAGVTHISNDSGCVEAPPGTLTCSLGEVAAGDSLEVTVVVEVAADLVYNAGGPTVITNSAGASSTTTDDDLSNNDPSQDTWVLAAADLEIVSFEAVDPPAEILLGEDVNILLRKIITNNGPSVPMDVELTVNATADPGAAVSPTAMVLQELALGPDELRDVGEAFTVSCSEPGSHSYTFVNSIQSLHPDDIELNPNNNQAQVRLDIECVVPVAINIKPGSYPNSINLKNQGVIPLAVLTTKAGEYDTPIDFDATTIKPLTVRFGPYGLVWPELGGAFEVHDKGHIEDSIELDETTQDGDQDMVLHFETHETGIDVDTAEACVKGAWTGPGGESFKFFGCDSVRITPNNTSSTAP